MQSPKHSVPRRRGIYVSPRKFDGSKLICSIRNSTMEGASAGNASALGLIAVSDRPQDCGSKPLLPVAFEFSRRNASLESSADESTQRGSAATAAIITPQQDLSIL